MRSISMNRIFWPAIALLIVVALLFAVKSYVPGVGAKKVGHIIRPPHEVSALAVKSGTIWAGGQEGVFAIDRQAGLVKSKLGEGQRFEYVKDLLVDQKGVLWIAHTKGLTSYDGRRFTTFTTREGLPDDRVNCICQDSQGRLWVGTWSGAACFQNGRWKVINHKTGLLVDMVNVMLEDSRGGLWFGSYAVRRGGVSYYNGISWNYLTTENKALPDPNISDIFEDSSGQVLIASGFVDHGGLVRIQMDDKIIKQKSILTREDGLAGEKVRSLFEEPSGVLWVASEYDGVARMSKAGITIYTTKSGLSGNEVKDWLLDEAGDLWMATNDGITLVRSDEFNDL